MINTKNLSKSFGNIQAINDITFHVDEGEIVGFLGPNGAGKTTTMRLLTGFISPDQGDISIAGYHIEKDPISARREIGYMPENNPLYKDMLVSELLILSARLKHIPKRQWQSAFDFVVTSTGIASIYYKLIRDLSKGFKQRVGMAIALLGKPRVLILDEPTEGLDPNQRAELRKLIKDLSKKHTILMSTHVMQEASAVCNRMIIIHKGKIIADGDTNALSRLAEKKRSIMIELEGEYVQNYLKEVEGIKDIQIIKTRNNRVTARLIVLKTAEIQPALSALIRQHKWVVWKLQEEEQNLEDIFHQLTIDL